jgi:hypothetical protein
MDKELIVLRMQELREQLADIDERLKALDDLLADGVTDEAIKKYANELIKIVNEKDTIISEARSLILLAEKEAPDIKDGGALVN